MQSDKNFIDDLVKALQGRYEPDNVKTLLLQNGVPETELESMLQLVKKQIANKRLNKGLNFIMFGALFLFAGFFCTICFHNSTAYQIPLYSLTVIGATLLVTGMMYIFG
jgi:hypothetical protein